MSAPVKITEAQIQLAIDVIAKRREALRTARLYPTIAVIAKQIGCTERYLQKLLAGRKRRSLA